MSSPAGAMALSYDSSFQAAILAFTINVIVDLFIVDTIKKKPKKAERNKTIRAKYKLNFYQVIVLPRLGCYMLN